MTKVDIEIPKPQHKYGYTYNQLETFLTEEELKKFNKWIGHQTCTADENMNAVYYSWDVQRFLEKERKGKLTYWD